VRCPGCGSKFQLEKFQLEADGSFQALVVPEVPLQRAFAPGEAGGGYNPEFAFADLSCDQGPMRAQKDRPADPGAPSLNAPLLVGVVIAAVLFLGAGVGLAVLCFSMASREAGEKDGLAENDSERNVGPKAIEKPAEPLPLTRDKKEEKQPEAPPSAAVQKPRVEMNPVVKAPDPIPRKKDPEKPKPAEASSPFKPLPREDQEKVNKAIDLGIVYLKACFDDQGSAGRDVVNTIIGPVSIQHLGATALAGLTLLACGVPASDPAVQKVIARVRKDAPAETNTYVISILILFLDQLGDSKDRALVRQLATRLLVGQTVRGGWPYACPNVSATDQEQLLKLLEERAPLNQEEAANSDQLRIRYRGVPVLSYRPGQRVSAGMPLAQTIQFNPGYDDNSTTQFAILALWAAQKAGIPVDKSLAMAEMRFRSLQNADGSWGYNKMYATLWCDSMTCAGLMGLAAGRGTTKLESPQEGREPKALGLGNDPQVKRALAFLGKTVGKPGIKRLAPPTASGRNNRLFGSTAEEDIFFLWSLERMSVIYSLEKIDGKEWYPWAVKLLVDAQRPDGSWIELYGSAPNTCFALLVLKRVNVVKDLTSKLQKLELSTLKKD
jgi:hypothetical protein